MSSVNLLAREVAAKIVFYGPGLSGKTTTLRKIHDSVRPAYRGEMMSLATEGDRTLFFDFMPVRVERVGDCAVRLALYTVPGQVFYNATRKLVLQGADGVVFVADSQPEATEANTESLRNLEDNLLEQGIRIERFPVVFQWNKRDLADAVPIPELRSRFNTHGAPDFETCATSGRGILDTLKAITRLVIKDLRAKRVVPSAGTSKTSAVPALAFDRSAGLTSQIEQHLDREPRPEASPPAPNIGPASALAPTHLFDLTRAAENAFLNGDYDGCIRAAHEAILRGLSYAGEGTSALQAYLLDVAGSDLLRFQSLLHRSPSRAGDAGFAMYVLMQVLTRLSAANFSPDI